MSEGSSHHFHSLTKRVSRDAFVVRYWRKAGRVAVRFRNSFHLLFPRKRTVASVEAKLTKFQRGVETPQVTFVDWILLIAMTLTCGCLSILAAGSSARNSNLCQLHPGVAVVVQRTCLSPGAPLIFQRDRRFLMRTPQRIQFR